MIFLNYFISGLFSTYKGFPLQPRNKLLEREQYPLNMIRTSRVQPKLSAYYELEGCMTSTTPNGTHQGPDPTFSTHPKPEHHRSHGKSTCGMWDLTSTTIGVIYYTYQRGAEKAFQSRNFSPHTTTSREKHQWEKTKYITKDLTIQSRNYWGRNIYPQIGI